MPESLVVPSKNPGRRARKLSCFLWLAALLPFCGALACTSNPPPQPPNPPPPPLAINAPPPFPAAVDPIFIFRTPDQVEINWPDMPITVIGGSEAFVFQRRTILNLQELRQVCHVQPFAGTNPGDRVEMEVSVYDKNNRIVYRTSPHQHSGATDYDAYNVDEGSLIFPGTSTDRFIVDLVGRVVGQNPETGRLDAGIHFAVTLTFCGADGNVPPPP